MKDKVTTVNDPTVASTETLWERLHSGLLDAQNCIVEIIDTRAWETLGYESFSKARLDRMSDISIATELRAARKFFAVSSLGAR
jgi:hypothetical protein